MTNLFEVVFEKIEKSCVSQAFFFLIQSAEKLTDTHCSEDIRLFANGELSEHALTNFVGYDGNISVLVKMQAMKLKGIVLPDVQLRLTKYGNEYDIDFNFNFDYDDIEDTSDTISCLYSLSKNLASEFDAACFYGGFEPAEDKDSRIFSNESTDYSASRLI